MSANKRSRAVRLVLMGTAPFALTACEQQQEALLYPTVEACTAAGVMTAEQCTTAFDQAKAANEQSAPRYMSRADCEADFGAGQCTQPTSGGGGFFFPFMSGFLLGQVLDGGGRYAPQPVYRPRNGDWTTGGGYTIGRQTGRVMVPEQATKPQRAITQSRAGFGSRAAARGGWGG